MTELRLPRVADFNIDGVGGNSLWSKAARQPLKSTGQGGSSYTTGFKAIYSQRGIYFLFDCEDKKISCSEQQFGADLFREDVVEVFLWPQEDQRTYFEYELSPLGAELPLLVCQDGAGRFQGWTPWHYHGDRRIKSATAVRAGEKKPQAAIGGWSAEFFIPFALLQGFPNCPPQPGAHWRATMARIDYDEAPQTCWAWQWNAPTFDTFHNLSQFGTIVFGE
ncbi:MAG: carbohydrate-binding family 9-like protein [Chitinivibrionales bacterium]|nr:carbohydrate-binding family 9-like protein [Chitinivibrionales bacterium]